MRGLQGLLQEDRAEGLEICVLGREGLPGRQTPTKPLPVLSIPEVPDGWHGQGGKQRRTKNILNFVFLNLLLYIRYYIEKL